MEILDPEEVAKAKNAELVPVDEEPPGLPIEPEESDPMDEPEEPAPQPAPKGLMSQKIPLPKEITDAIKEKKARDATRQVTISESEYGSISNTITGLQQMKNILETNPNPEISSQVGFMEASLWDGVVKRFGFPTMESAQQAGVTFSLKTIRVIECRPRDT